jgi:hypothetical protein
MSFLEVPPSYLRFEAVISMTVKIVAIQNVMMCSLVEVNSRSKMVTV